MTMDQPVVKNKMCLFHNWLPMVLFVLTICFSTVMMPVHVEAGDAEYVIKFGTVAPDNTPWANHLKKIKTRVEKASGGRIKYKLFLGGAMGGEVEMVRSLRRGRLQCFGGSTAAVAEGAAIPELQILELPYLFESFEEVDYILDNVVYDDFKTILKAKGFYMAYWMKTDGGILPHGV